MLERTLQLLVLQVDLQRTASVVPGRGSWPLTHRGTDSCSSVRLVLHGGRVQGWGSTSVSSQSVCVSPAPKVKRPRLEAVKRLNFGQDEMEELPLPDSPLQDITPPPSPEIPAELGGEGCVAWGPGVLKSWDWKVLFVRQGPKAWGWGPVGGLGSRGWIWAPYLSVTGSKSS